MISLFPLGVSSGAGDQVRAGEELLLAAAVSQGEGEAGLQGVPVDAGGAGPHGGQHDVTIGLNAIFNEIIGVSDKSGSLSCLT